MKKFMQWFAQPAVARKFAKFSLWIGGFYAVCFILAGQAWIASIILATAAAGWIIAKTQPQPVMRDDEEYEPDDDFFLDPPTDQEVREGHRAVRDQPVIN